MASLLLFYTYYNQGSSILLIGSAICPADMSTWPSPDPPWLAQKTQASQAVRQARQNFPEIWNSQAIQAENVFLPGQLEFFGPIMGGEQSSG